LHLPEAEVERVMEVGPGKVLTGLIKRMCPGVALVNINGVADLPD
jgi:[acyl-carrier-protein] S-malonyltransferase